MKKSLLIVGLAAGLHVACGGVTTGDIEDAARELDAEESGSGLRLALGQTWEGTETRVTTGQFGSVSTAGQFNEITASKSVDQETWALKNKAVKTSYVEAADKNGFVIESVQRKTSGKSTTGSLTVDETLSNLDERSSHVMFELDGWARTIVEGVADADLNPGSASHPLAPGMNGVYVSDTGAIYKADAVEAVGNFRTVVLTRQNTPDLYKIEDFYKDCFEVVQGPSGPGFSDVNVRASCIGNQIKGGEAAFTKERSTKLYVGRQLVLKSVTKSDVIRLDVLVCTVGAVITERNFNTGLTDCNGSISLGRQGGPVEEIVESTFEVTAIGKDADRDALPEITTAPVAQ